ncbi:transaldolase family protein [Facilibium subflavum]|uniref:transaldolase family protein n=1 Tax=Facilibium subflavum TaxID=2219058 RepID=UPI000E6590E4|nr:transaldolase family protein [Facilibium subflavum]
MEIWLDSADTHFIKNCHYKTMLDGVTTNPSILSQSHDTPMQTIEQILHLQQKELCVQVTAKSTDKIIDQARKLHNISARIIVKIPVTQAGIVAMQQLIKEEIKVLATAVVSAKQAMLACKLNVDYIAPYYHHIKNNNPSWQQEIDLICKMNTMIPCRSKIMLASLKTLDDVNHAIALQAQAITIVPELMDQLFEAPELTQKAIEKFDHDWATVKDDLLALA